MHLYEIKLLIQGRIAYVHRMDHIHSKIVQKIVKQVGCFGGSGGKVTNLFGEPFRYSLGGQTEESCLLWGGLIVTPSEEFHRWCLERIPAELTNHLKRYEPAK